MAGLETENITNVNKVSNLNSMLNSQVLVVENKSKAVKMHRRINDSVSYLIEENVVPW